jgi:hypothetical protein
MFPNSMMTQHLNEVLETAACQDTWRQGSFYCTTSKTIVIVTVIVTVTVTVNVTVKLVVIVTVTVTVIVKQ